MSRLFGTDGVRGVANKELTVELAYKLGQCGAHVLAGETQHAPKIIVGVDTRISCDMLENALVAGICSVGAEAIILGVIPTPAVAYLIKRYNADAGVMISASHNPFEFNGIKFFNRDGYKLSDETEDKIEELVRGIVELPELPSGDQIGRRTEAVNAQRDYAAHITESADIRLNGMKVILDCANGASYKVAPEIFTSLGAEVEVINNLPDGTNINRNCGSTHIEGLAEEVIKRKADIGIAFDGDADRMLAIDEKGNYVDGDTIMAIMAMDMKRKGLLAKNTVVVTVMSNLGFDIMAKENDLNLVKTKVGDRYVLEEMMRSGYSIGGEQSGHIILLDHNTTGDGPMSAVTLACILKKSGKSFSELASIITVLPQILVNAKVSNDKKYKYMENPTVAKFCDNLEKEFSGKGRVLIRPSGTEPLVRVMIEGSDIDYITKKANELAQVIEDKLN